MVLEKTLESPFDCKDKLINKAERGVAGDKKKRQRNIYVRSGR